jgi:hypothetical protein
MAGCCARAARVIEAADEVARALELGRGRRHEDERAGAIQAHELLGVAPVGLDPVAGANGDQRRRDHVARDAEAAEQAQQVIAARPRLVGHGQAFGPGEALDQPADRALRVLEALDLRRPPLGGSVAATIEFSCTSSAIHSRT